MLAATIAAISLIGTLLGLRDIIPTVPLLIGALLFCGLTGWAAAIYVAYSTKMATSPVEALISAISETVQVPFTESWIRATILSQRAVDAYWGSNKSLHIEEIICKSSITARDVENVITIKGRNSSKLDVDSCPMLLIGGSVLHFSEFAVNAASLKRDAGDVALAIRSNLDLGLLQLIDIMFPTVLKRGETFVVEHKHDWPGAMTPGTDIMWYPFAAMFARDVDRLTVKVDFAAPASYIRGFVADLDSGTCTLSPVQPVETDDARKSFEWTIDSADNQAIYALVFDRR
ncbi:hypothetical protein [Streptomyces sp. 2A115]|uniref:hypothetical protein n=1 Tax=Streptomyces sp. 2A115 TaxID=3457439 RepID=UPI003FD3E7A5